MARVKRAMDPAGILNPARDLGCAHVPRGFLALHQHLRRDRTVFDEPEYRDMIEMCHGCGTCRDYCRGTRPRSSRTPARAKAVLTDGDDPRGALARVAHGEAAQEVMDSCFNCKMCLTECPSQVDIPGLAIAARKGFVEKHGMPVRNWILGHADKVAAVAGLAPAAVNLVVGRPWSAPRARRWGRSRGSWTCPGSDGRSRRGALRRSGRSRCRSPPRRMRRIACARASWPHAGP